MDIIANSVQTRDLNIQSVRSRSELIPPFSRQRSGLAPRRGRPASSKRPTEPPRHSSAADRNLADPKFQTAYRQRVRFAGAPAIAHDILSRPRITPHTRIMSTNHRYQCSSEHQTHPPHHQPDINNLSTDKTAHNHTRRPLVQPKSSRRPTTTRALFHLQPP